MASNYPGAADSFDTIAADKKTSDAVGGRTHRAMHNDLGDAIEAVQTELGTDPSGGAATVKARFEVIEANDWVTSARIAADAVGTSEIAANAVGASELADNAVDTAAIANGAVTAAKILIGAATFGSGTGTPEGVVTAAPGSTWLQTDSTTDVKGWIKWVKATGTGNTGWVAGPEADTGWRDIAASATANTGQTITDLQIRRAGSAVFLRWGVTNTTGGNRLTIYTAPSGFRPVGYIYTKAGTLDSNPAAADVAIAAFPDGTIEYGQAGSGSRFDTEMSWHTANAWPTSLPGDAA